MNESDPSGLRAADLQFTAHESGRNKRPSTGLPARHESAGHLKDGDVLINSIGSDTDLKTLFRHLIRHAFLCLNDFQHRCRAHDSSERPLDLVTELVELTRFVFFLADRLHPPDTALRMDNKTCLRELEDLLKGLRHRRPLPAPELDHSMDSLIFQLVRNYALGKSYVAGQPRVGAKAPHRSSTSTVLRPGRPVAGGARLSRKLPRQERDRMTGEDGVDPGSAGAVRSHLARN